MRKKMKICLFLHISACYRSRAETQWSALRLLNWKCYWHLLLKCINRGPAFCLFRLSWQIHLAIWTKTFYNLDKYSLQLETNEFWKCYWHCTDKVYNVCTINCCNEGPTFVFLFVLRNTFSDLDKYIMQLGQM